MLTGVISRTLKEITGAYDIVTAVQSIKGNVRCEPDRWDHGPDRIDARAH